VIAEIQVDQSDLINKSLTALSQVVNDEVMWWWSRSGADDYDSCKRGQGSINLPGECLSDVCYPPA